MQYIMHLEKLCLYFIHVSYLIIACIVAVWIPLKLPTMQEKVTILEGIMCNKALVKYASK